MNTASTPRQCFYIDLAQSDEEGFIPSIVTEGEAGHSPMTGTGPHAAPWHWGPTYEQATAQASEQNRKVFGLDDDEALEIVASSMRASGRSRPGGNHRDWSGT